MSETSVHPHAKKWIIIFVVGLVFLLIVALVIILSGDQRSNTPAELTGDQQQALIDQLEEQSQQEKRDFNLTEEQQEAFIANFEEANNAPEPTPLTEEEQQALIDQLQSYSN